MTKTYNDVNGPYDNFVGGDYDVEYEFRTFYKTDTTGEFYLVDYIKAVKESLRVSLPASWYAECLIDFVVKLNGDSSFSHNYTSASTYTSVGSQYSQKESDTYCDYHVLATDSSFVDAIDETTSEHYNKSTVLTAKIVDIEDIILNFTIYNSDGDTEDTYIQYMSDRVTDSSMNLSSFSSSNQTSLYGANAFNIWVPVKYQLVEPYCSGSYTIDNATCGLSVRAYTEKGLTGITDLCITLIPVATSANTEFPRTIRQQIVNDYTITKWTGNNNTAGFSSSELGKLTYQVLIRKAGYDFGSSGFTTSYSATKQLTCPSAPTSYITVAQYAKEDSSENTFYFYLQDEDNVSYPDSTSMKRPRISSLQVGNTYANRYVDFTLGFRLILEDNIYATICSSSSSQSGSTTISGYNFTYEYLYSQDVSSAVTSGCLLRVTCSNGPSFGFDSRNFLYTLTRNSNKPCFFDNTVTVTDIYNNYNTNSLNFYEYSYLPGQGNQAKRTHTSYCIGIPIYRKIIGVATQKIAPMKYYLSEFAATMTHSYDGQTTYSSLISDLDDYFESWHDDSTLNQNMTVSPTRYLSNNTYPNPLNDLWIHLANEDGNLLPTSLIRNRVYITKLIDKVTKLRNTVAENNLIHTRQFTYADAQDNFSNESNKNYVIFYAASQSTIQLNKLSSKQTIWITSKRSGSFRNNLTAGNTWQKMSQGDSITLTAGDFIFMKGILRGENSSSDYTNIGVIGNVYASGNINALVNYANIDSPSIEFGYACYGLFSGSTGLHSAPEIPAEILKNYCYAYMFQGCTGLYSSPNLPAKTVATASYQRMFDGCSSLITAGEISAEFLNGYSCQYMFYGCSSLISVQESLYAISIPQYSQMYMFGNCTSLRRASYQTAIKCDLYGCSSMYRGCIYLGVARVPFNASITNANYCYSYMFYGCTRLTTAPRRINNNNSLASYCYYMMFYNCTNLLKAPELQSITLAQYCYAYMFYGCRHITTAPTLPAKSLSAMCYYQMFYHCSRLNYIECLATTQPNTACTQNWVYGVAKQGTFKKNDNSTIWTRGVNGIPTKWIIDGPFLVFIAHESNCAFSLPSISENRGLQYSPDSSNWSALNQGAVISVYSGATIYVRGTTTDSITALNPTTFGLTGKFSCIGNVNAAWNYTNLNAALKYACGAYMFSGCTSLIQAPTLPSTDLAEYCYRGMFLGCTSLTTAPELPATILQEYCYQDMFSGCTSLTTAPELPATTLAKECYDNMFGGCTSLTTAPVLPATTLEYYCYLYMFRNCTSLTQAPELPATTLASGCYSCMFEGCSSLAQAPELPAVHNLPSACYYSMFRDCTSLTQAPELPAYTLSEFCYNSMFYGCTHLNYVRCLAIDRSALNCTRSWLQNVSSTGTFYKNPSMNSWPRDANGIPANWTVYNV